MKLALIEPFISPAVIVDYKSTEPTHLLGMYNMVKDMGVEVEIIDALSYKMKEEELVEKIVKDGFTHIGFTTYEYIFNINYIKNVIDQVRDDVIIIFGGPGVTFSTDVILKYITPDFIVKGDGEKVLVNLVKSDFNPVGLGEEIKVNKIGEVVVLQSNPYPLDEIPYERPYSFDFYHYEGSPRIQQGCSGQCIFCSGAYKEEVYYRSPEKCIEIFKYLLEKKEVKTITSSGPDFCNKPEKANEIVKAIIESNLKIETFKASVRLDTLLTSIKMDEDLWREFGQRIKLSLEASIESFSIDRLNRFNKYMPEFLMQNIFEHLERIFSVTHAFLSISRIAFDPLMSIEEFINDNKQFIELFERFPKQVTIVPQLFNSFYVIWGTPALEKGAENNPWASPDDYKDPAVAKLKEYIVKDKKLQDWIKRAERTRAIVRRNLAFREILKDTVKKAETLKIEMNNFLDEAQETL